MAARGSAELLGRLEALGIDTAAGLLHTGGDADLYREVLLHFVRDRSACQQALADALAAQDWNAYRVSAHALKGAARTIGANELADAAYVLECAARDAQAQRVVAQHPALVQGHDAVVRSLAEALGEPEAQARTRPSLPAQGPIDARQLLDVLREAWELMDAFEVGGAQELLRSVHACTYEGRVVGELCATIRDDLDTFEVESALNKTQALIDELSR